MSAADKKSRLEEERRKRLIAKRGPQLNPAWPYRVIPFPHDFFFVTKAKP